MFHYLVFSKLWRHAAVDCCPENYTTEASKYYTATYAAQSCLTKDPEYCIVTPFVLSHNHLVLI
jgi:hypothetical protein